MPKMSEIIAAILRGKRFYLAVAVCCFLEWLALWRVAPNCWFDSDTVSYFFPVNLFAGRISAVRPPVYCLFLNALRWFGDARLPALAVAAQFAILLGTILLAAKMLRALFGYAIPVLIVCAYLALQGYFWAKALLPECFSFCATVLAVFLFWRMTVAPSKRLAWGLNILMAIAVLLKPVFLVMAIALFLAWGFFIVAGDGRRRCTGAILLSYVVSLGIVLGYCSLMQVRHGMFGVSSVGIQNDLLNIISSSAWTTCGDSRAKALLSEELQNNPKRTYATVFALQWAVIPKSGEQTDLNEIAPDYLMENGNARFCRDLASQYTKGTLYSLDELRDFIREAKRQPLFQKFLLQKLFIAFGAPRGVFIVPFWLGVTGLVVSLSRRNHLLFFTNLLLVGFLAAVVLKIDILVADPDANERLLYPVFLIPWMNLLSYFSHAWPTSINRDTYLCGSSSRQLGKMQDDPD